MSEETEPNPTPDKLIVTGIPGLDGEYQCNLTDMALEGFPESLTNREGHRVKVMAGVRAGELLEALNAGDNDVFLAFAAIILTRRGKRFDEAVLWDAPMGVGVSFDIASRDDGTDEVDPPLPAASGQSDTSGGTSGEQSSDPSPSDPSSTGSQPSDTSATSDPVRLAS